MCSLVGFVCEMHTQVFMAFCFDCLTLEVGTDRLSQNICNILPIYAA